MTIRGFDKRSKDIKKLWKQMWFEIVIKPLKEGSYEC